MKEKLSSFQRHSLSLLFPPSSSRGDSKGKKETPFLLFSLQKMKIHFVLGVVTASLALLLFATTAVFGASLDVEQVQEQKQTYSCFPWLFNPGNDEEKTDSSDGRGRAGQ